MFFNAALHMSHDNLWLTLALNSPLIQKIKKWMAVSFTFRLKAMFSKKDLDLMPKHFQHKFIVTQISIESLWAKYFDLILMRGWLHDTNIFCNLMYFSRSAGSIS